MMQSSEDPFQQDMIEELPDDALRVYNDPDQFVKDAESQAVKQGKIFVRNQHIAVSDYLKDKKQDSRSYQI